MSSRIPRPPVFTWNDELHYGPPSELINLQKFHDRAQELQEKGSWPWLDYESQGTSKTAACQDAIKAWKDLQGLSPEDTVALVEGCDVTDLAMPLLNVMASDKLNTYVQNVNARVVQDVLGTTTYPTKNAKGKGREELEDPETAVLRKAFEHTQLNIWPLKPSSKPYIRRARLTDQNALVNPRFTSTPLESQPISRDILLTFSTYNKVKWYPYPLLRTSQYAIPSTHTLLDLWKCIPCPLKGHGTMPVEIVETERTNEMAINPNAPPKTAVVGYNVGDTEADKDPVVIVIEDVVYCDGTGETDYADKFLAHAETFKPKKSRADSLLGPYERAKPTKLPQKGSTLEQTTLRSLSLRINEPYSILHRGNCEHFFVVDDIRLQNPHDPVAGYPICVQRIPKTGAVCRICNKVPSILSILNDARLGESPAVVCGPCWELFGGPPSPKEGESIDNRVVVVPMVFET